MIRTSKPTIATQNTKLLEFLERFKAPRILTPEILHPATRTPHKSFNRREQMRRNQAQYGKRQLQIAIRADKVFVYKDYHMPKDQRRDAETKTLDALEAYQSALYASGYRLLKGTPKTLTYQYEGRLH